jgi:hypothetical protein
VSLSVVRNSEAQIYELYKAKNAYVSNTNGYYLLLIGLGFKCPKKIKKLIYDLKTKKCIKKLYVKYKKKV